MLARPQAFYVHECFAYMYVYIPLAFLLPLKPEEGVGAPGTRVKHG